jgi:transposase
MFSYVSAEQRVPPDSSLRAIRVLADDILRDMSQEFDRLYASVGRPSVPPERRLRAQLLQIFYSIRSERLLMEQLDYTLLFRRFVGIEMDEPISSTTVFTKNRESTAESRDGTELLRSCRRARARPQSDEHFTVDGTLIEAWASQKSFQRKEAGPMAMAGNSAASRDRTTRMRRQRIPTPVVPAHPSRRSQAVVSRPSTDREPARVDRRCPRDPRGWFRGA